MSDPTDQDTTKRKVAITLVIAIVFAVIGVGTAKSLVPGPRTTPHASDPPSASDSASDPPSPAATSDAPAPPDATGDSSSDDADEKDTSGPGEDAHPSDHDTSGDQGHRGEPSSSGHDQPSHHHSGSSIPRPKSTVDCHRKKIHCVALTFDDGPSPDTPRLLKTLRKKHAPATFFLVGSNVEKYPETVRKEAKQKHVLGNHTWDHPELTHLKKRQVRRQITRTNKAITATGAPRPHLLRPPYGAADRDVLQVFHQKKMASVLWNVDTEDWKNRSTKITTRRAVSGARDGAIILMHDIHPTTVDAVSGIIHRLRKHGYTLVTVPDLIGSNLTWGKTYFDEYDKK